MVITGASSGIGLATARLAAKRGGKVAVMREFTPPSETLSSQDNVVLSIMEFGFAIYD